MKKWENLGQLYELLNMTNDASIALLPQKLLFLALGLLPTRKGYTRLKWKD